MYMAWCIFILQKKSIVYIFLLINSCMKFVSWIFFFSCTIFWHPTSICPTGFLFWFLFCIIVSNVGRNWIFWSIQSVMGFGICGHRFRRSPFTNKIFYIYKSRLSLCQPLQCSDCSSETDSCLKSPTSGPPSRTTASWWGQRGPVCSQSLDEVHNSLQAEILPWRWIKKGTSVSF